MGCGGSKQTDQVTIDPKKEEPAAPPRLSAHNLGESWVDETPNPALQFDLDNDGDKEVVHGLKFQTAKPKPAEEPVKKEASVKKEPEKKEPEKREPEKKPSLVKQLSNALSPRASKMKREEEEEAAKLEAEKLEAERQRLAAAEAKAAKEAQERVEAAAAKVVAAEIAEEAIDHGIKLYEAEANKPGVLTKTMKSVGRSLRNLFKPEDEKEEPEPDVPPPPPRKPSTHEPPPRIAAKIAFKHMDKNGDGELSRSEVIDACRKDPEIRSMLNLPTIHVDQFEGEGGVFEEMFKAMDSDNNNTIDEGEFVKWFVSEGKKKLSEDETKGLLGLMPTELAEEAEHKLGHTKTTEHHEEHAPVIFRAGTTEAAAPASVPAPTTEASKPAPTATAASPLSSLTVTSSDSPSLTMDPVLAPRISAADPGLDAVLAPRISTAEPALNLGDVDPVLAPRVSVADPAPSTASGSGFGRLKEVEEEAPISFKFEVETDYAASRISKYTSG